MTLRIFPSVFLLIMISFCSHPVMAQFEKITIDLQKDKPEKFKNRKLRSERTDQKKLKLPQRFVQNTTSHYNFYFNGRNKIASVIENARMNQQEDYTKLLPYYSYSLENTASQENDLDSVIQKATSGILLHDLRSDWVDNFYMLIGEAYYLKKEFDSAYMAFQFINFNLNPQTKKNKNNPVVIGSTANNVSGSFSIANKEDRNILQKAFSMPASRNDALVWQIRTLTDMGSYAEAASLISTLRNDPNFPPRLESQLNEIEGYWFYKQEIYDSAIQYIERGLPNSIDQQDKARREYLLAQLFENKQSIDTAFNYYSLAIRHTTNPLLDIWANLNRAKLRYSEDPEEISSSVNRLAKMARKEKYRDFRDLVYYAAGELALDIPDTLATLAFYERSTRFNQNNSSLKNKAFLKMADISYALQDYKSAHNYYDSLQTSDTTLGDIEQIKHKKSALAAIVKEINIIEREDSLQTIAALPTSDREAFLKKLSRKLRKELGLKDEEFEGDFDLTSGGNKKGSTDIFSQGTTDDGWYFDNQAIKSKGFNDFKREWGTRQNIDNWRRLTSQSLARNQANSATPEGDPLAPPAPATGGENQTATGATEESDISIDGLRANLPLTQPQLDISNEKIATATYTLGKNFQSLLEDYPAALRTYYTSLDKFPDSLYQGELYLNMAYCYKQLGNEAMYAKYLNMLNKDFQSSEIAQKLLNPEKNKPEAKDTTGTALYNQIYTQFIEGNFDQAIGQKKTADSLYGKSFWTPQLLYIESVYYIKQRQDSLAIDMLSRIPKEFPETPMKDKVDNLIRVLKNRDTIESYLTKLEVKRMPEDSQVVVFKETRIYGNIGPKPVRNDSNLIPRKITTVDIPVITNEKKAPAVTKNQNFVIDPLSPQNIVMLLTKVDPVYISEARTALLRYTKSTFYNRTINIVKDTLDDDRTLLVFSEFVSAEDAMTVLDRLKRNVGSEISWLPADKYSFIIISDENLELLKENKKLENYLDLLTEKYPGKF